LAQYERKLQHNTNQRLPQHATKGLARKSPWLLPSLLTEPRLLAALSRKLDSQSRATAIKKRINMSQLARKDRNGGAIIHFRTKSPYRHLKNNPDAPKIPPAEKIPCRQKP
jgi:hypothetical protein